MHPNESQRGREVMQAIRDALMRHWDPIGVADVPEAADEYDSYIAQVYRILAGTRSADELIEFLYRTETQAMGLNAGSCEHLREVARILLTITADTTSMRGPSPAFRISSRVSPSVCQASHGRPATGTQPG